MGSEIFSENIKFLQRRNFIRQFYSLAPPSGAAKAGVTGAAIPDSENLSKNKL